MNIRTSAALLGASRGAGSARRAAHGAWRSRLFILSMSSSRLYL